MTVYVCMYVCVCVCVFMRYFACTSKGESYIFRCSKIAIFQFSVHVLNSINVVGMCRFDY